MRSGRSGRAGLAADELQGRARCAAELLHPTEMELRKIEMGDRRFRGGRRPGAIELLERTVGMMGNPILDRHPKNPRLGVERDKRGMTMGESRAPRNHLDQARRRSCWVASWWR